MKRKSKFTSEVPTPPVTRLDLLVAKCGGAHRQSGKETVCRCPAHHDENPSLNVTLGDDGKLLVTCRAGCKTADILRAIGWKLSDLMASAPQSRSPKPRTRSDSKPKPAYPTVEAIAAAAAKWKNGLVESTHVYFDTSSEPVFGVVRVRRTDGSKDVPQIRRDAGGWVFGGIKGNRPLYRLRELLTAPADVPVCLFEGEQKADLAAELGFVATACSQGAGNSKLTDFSPLSARILHLFADNDAKGQQHMKEVASRAIAAGAETVWLVTLPDLPPKGDIVDLVREHRAAGKPDEQIANEIRTAIQSATRINADGDAEIAVDDEDEVPPPMPSVSVADQIVALAADATLFHDEHDDPFASVIVDGHRENWRVASERFSRWLASLYYRAFGIAVPPSAMTTAISQLSAMALFDGQRHPVHMRVARSGSAIYLDLCNDTWQAIEITAQGWRIVDQPEVRFARRPGMKTIATPVPGLANLDPLFDLLHFEDRDLRLLVTAWMVNAMAPSGSYPILAPTGEQGSGKTTFCRALQRLIDPHAMEGRSPPRNEEDIAVAAQHAHMIVYENLSGVTQSLSDSLCRVATGAGFAARKLYTNDEERQLQFCRPVIINGIDDLATRSDLADRIVSVPLQPIPKEYRQAESNLWARFEEMRPQLVGALLHLRVRVEQQQDIPAPLERMADFSRLGVKVAVAVGLDADAFVFAYRANRDAASLTALDSSAIGPVLRRVVRRGRFHGLITGLLQQLLETASQHEARHPEWPRTPRALGDSLRRLAPNLARIGVEVVFHGHRRDGHWVTVEETPAGHGHNGHDGHAEPQAKEVP